MGEKWTEERRLKIEFARLQRKIQPFNLLLHRIIRVVKENPNIDVLEYFDEETRSNLIKLDEITIKLGYNLYNFEKDKEV